MDSQQADLEKPVFPTPGMTERTEAVKQAAPGTGQITISEKEWDAFQQRWEQRLRNQRQVIDNLDDARLVERNERLSLLDKLKTVHGDLDALVRTEKDERHRTNYEVLRDTLADLIKIHR